MALNYQTFIECEKTHHMIFSGVNSVPPMIWPTNNLNIEEEISEFSKTKFFGVIIDNKPKWQHHIMYIFSKISKGLGVINKALKFLNTDSLKNYYAFVYPYYLYCNYIWGKCVAMLFEQINCITEQAIRITAPQFTTFQELRVMDLQQWACT